MLSGVLLFFAIVIGIIDVSAKTRLALYAVSVFLVFFGGSVADTSLAEQVELVADDG